VKLRSALLLVCLLALPAPRAWAVREWHDHYAEGEAALRQGRFQQALKAFQDAVRLKSESELNARPYGMEFVEYVPYYKQGICYLKLGDFNSAERMFNIEEDKGAIKRSELYRELRKLRSEAQTSERQRVARLARDDAARFQREASELYAARRYDEALARLASAQSIAVALDPAAQRQIAELRDRIRTEQRAQTDGAERSRRIEQELAEAARLLEAGKPTEAAVRFDQVLALDPANRRAADGKRDAQERILASKNRQTLESAFQEGRALFETGRYEEALRPLTDAAVDPANALARDLLDRAQRIVAGLRQQRDVRQKIERLLDEAERLIAGRKFPEAQVRLEEAIALDPGNTRAKERLGFAEMRTGEELSARWRPNRPPSVTIIEPRGSEVELEAASVAIVGVASDDQRVARIEFFFGGSPAGSQVPAPQQDAGDYAPSVRFEKVFKLEPGPNEIAVVATDSLGLKRRETVHVQRRLRFHETRAFLPSAAAVAVGLVGLGLGAQHLRRRRAVRRRFNPYIAGAPVMDDDLFFGREKLLAHILNVLHHNSLMITGERRIGKTSFLYHLKKALERDDATDYRFFPVFIDLQGVTEAGFFHSVMADVVEALSPAPDTRAALRFSRDPERYDGRDFSHDMQRLIEALKATTEKRVKLTLLIDEVDVLNEFSERTNQRLRSIFMRTFSESLVAVMSGVGVRRTWKSEGSPWYNFFAEIELSAFSREDAEALIRTPVDGVFRYQPEAVEAILRHSALKPYLLQKYCIYAVNRIIERGSTLVTAADVEAVREAVEFESQAPELPAAAAHESA
jgi:tetratricopeptide (TPR) repeat protein